MRHMSYIELPLPTGDIMANSPTPAELTLLRALWVQGELSAREIHDETVAETGWSYSSTRKTLDRMEAKKFLQVKSVHRMKVFVPARSKLATLADLINHFASDFLDTKNTMSAAALPAVTSLIQMRSTIYRRCWTRFLPMLKGQRNDSGSINYVLGCCCIANMGRCLLRYCPHGEHIVVTKCPRLRFIISDRGAACFVRFCTYRDD